MKTEAEIERAIGLLTLALTGQVKLRNPMTKEVYEQTVATIRALQWAAGHPTPLNGPMDAFLNQVQSLSEEPGFNPHKTLAE